LIIPSLDRLSRDVRLAENLFYELARAGVEVLIADMPTYNGKDRKDVLIRQIREAIAEENRKDIIDRLWKGRQERVRRGLPAGGNVPYGYRRNGTGIAIDAAEGETVRTIFGLGAAGKVSDVIAAVLNNSALRRRNGQAWTGRQIRAVLARRELYEKGVFRYGQAVGENRELILIPPSDDRHVGDDGLP
jgi:DNA invertase Pin-like site-specific DNA recombinase